MKRKYWRCCRKCCLALLLIWALLILLALFTEQGKRAIRFIEKGNDCSDTHSVVFIEETCKNHSKGLVSGTFCEHLCSGAVQFKTCLGHGVKPHVLLAGYGDTEIVLKAKRLYSDSAVKSHIHELSRDKIYSYKEFLLVMNLTIASRLFSAKEYVAHEQLDKLFEECDGNGDKQIGFNEAASCFRILCADEYIFYLLLHGIPGIPDTYGTCGNIFAVQNIPATNMRDHILTRDPRTWEKRARIALSLLDMIEALEKTPHGVLYLCDVQETNFGVSEGVDGSLKAYAIDLDISFFEKDMYSMVTGQVTTPCEQHSDCDIVSCWSQCDMETKMCKGSLYSSNLQVLCLEILQTHGFYDPGLLYNAPDIISEHLNNLLDLCSNPKHLIRFSDDVLVKSPLNMLSGLRNLLRNSISS